MLLQSVTLLCCRGPSHVVTSLMPGVTSLIQGVMFLCSRRHSRAVHGSVASV